jgi:hypothetical protein
MKDHRPGYALGVAIAVDLAVSSHQVHMMIEQDGCEPQVVGGSNG